MTSSNKLCAASETANDAHNEPLERTLDDAIQLMKHLGYQFDVWSKFGSGFGKFYREFATHEETIYMGVFNFPNGIDEIFCSVRAKVDNLYGCTNDASMHLCLNGIRFNYQGRSNMRSTLVAAVELLESERSKVSHAANIAEQKHPTVKRLFSHVRDFLS